MSQLYWVATWRAGWRTDTGSLMCESMMPIDCARCGSSKCSSFVLWFADASADALAALPARARGTLHLAFAIGYAPPARVLPVISCMLQGAWCMHHRVRRLNRRGEPMSA